MCRLASRRLNPLELINIKGKIQLTNYIIDNNIQGDKNGDAN